MMRFAAALVAGLVFSFGLIISGMVNPAKVQNFLDVAGNWDPSLAFVMIGAIAVGALGFRLVTKRPAPLFADAFSNPVKTRLDPALIAGAAIFGVGWGLAGFCPGPALTSLPAAATATLIFVPCMLVGMWTAKTVKIKRAA